MHSDFSFTPLQINVIAVHALFEGYYKSVKMHPVSEIVQTCYCKSSSAVCKLRVG